jgi:hypothetical protein
MVRLTTLVAVLLAAWLGTIVASGAGWNPTGGEWNFTNSGAFGDSFGPLSTLMAAAAAVSALFALREQRDEVRRLRAGDVEAKIAQRVSRDEQTFFNLLDLFRDVVSRTDIQRHTLPDKSGSDAFGLILGLVIQGNGANIELVYQKNYERYINDLAHYFRLLYNILVFVDRSTLEGKYFYAKVIRSMLSEGELGLIALNSIYGEGNPKLKLLVEKYALLNNVSDKLSAVLRLRALFHPYAFDRTVPSDEVE